MWWEAKGQLIKDYRQQLWSLASDGLGKKDLVTEVLCG